MIVYLIGSLRNQEIPHVGNALRKAGHDVYDDWFAGGKEADDEWQQYEYARGRDYLSALEGWHAQQVFNNDLTHLNRAEVGVLVLPAGKSAHLELGYLIGQGKPGYILLNAEPDRFDLMYRFLYLTGGKLCLNVEEIVDALRDLPRPVSVRMQADGYVGTRITWWS